MSFHVISGIICLAIVLINLLPTSSIFTSDPPYYSQIYAKIPLARTILVDDAGDILVSTRLEESKIILLYEVLHFNETDNSTSLEVVQDILLDAPDFKINHGLAFNKGYLYVSNSSNVFRWSYQPGQRTRLNVSDAQVVVSNIPRDGVHASRTIVFDLDDLFYVQVGSFDDVDPDASRSKIRRFNLTNIPPVLGFDFQMAEIFADGVRNEVGLAFDLNGQLWGVENEVNYPDRPDLGYEIWMGNPAEELHRFTEPTGTNYGYPFCFSTYELENVTTNTQFVNHNFVTDEGIYSDEWCRDIKNNHPPTLAMPAHTAPLGIHFYNRTDVCGNGKGAFPCSAIGDAFIAFHATEFLEKPTLYGNRVSWLPFNWTANEPTGEYITIIYEQNVTAGNCGGTCFRPVNAVFDLRGQMFVSSDWAGEIYRVTYDMPPPIISKYTVKY